MIALAVTLYCLAMLGWILALEPYLRITGKVIFEDAGSNVVRYVYGLFWPIILLRWLFSPFLSRLEKVINKVDNYWAKRLKRTNVL